MIRGVVAAFSLISILAALIIVALLMVNQLGSLSGGLAGDAPAGGTTGSLVLRISGTPGVEFSGDYTTPQGSQSFSGTLSTTPTDYELGGEGVAGLSLVTVNVQRQGMGGTLKVEILKDGQVVKTAETTATNNTVSLTYSS